MYLYLLLPVYELLHLPCTLFATRHSEKHCQ